MDERRKDLIEFIEAAQPEAVADYIIRLQDKYNALLELDFDESWKRSQQREITDRYGNHVGWR